MHRASQIAGHLRDQGARTTNTAAEADIASSDVARLGLSIRKSVVGEEYVAKSIANADDFSIPFQKFVTEYCWGAVWGREGLEKKTRSLLNLAILTALGRLAALKIHVRGALKNGVTEEEIREVLIHTAVYAGVPAALVAFKIAKEVIDEEKAAKRQ